MLQVPEGCTFHWAFEHVLCAAEDSSSSHRPLGDHVASRALVPSLFCMGWAGMGLHCPQKYKQAQRAQVCGPLRDVLTYSKLAWRLQIGLQVASLLHELAGMDTAPSLKILDRLSAHKHEVFANWPTESLCGILGFEYISLLRHHTTRAPGGHASRLCFTKAPTSIRSTKSRRAERHFHAWRAAHRPGGVACMHRLHAQVIAATCSTRSLAVAAASLFPGL